MESDSFTEISFNRQKLLGVFTAKLIQSLRKDNINISFRKDEVEIDLKKVNIGGGTFALACSYVKNFIDENNIAPYFRTFKYDMLFSDEQVMLLLTKEYLSYKNRATNLNYFLFKDRKFKVCSLTEGNPEEEILSFAFITENKLREVMEGSSS